tara:strand:+ start:109 stop:495 length:387 start_codon:yes stop_codon:yes gene_type:complete
MTRKDSEGKLQRSGLRGSVKETSQQAMELTAIIEAFRRINERQLADRPIAVYTSSNYINQGISTWLAGWKAKNWKGANKKPVKNAELWQELDKWNEEFKPTWEFITNEGDHPASAEVKAMAVSAGKIA